METLEIIFWSCAAVVFYAYVGYAMILGIICQLRKCEPRRQVGHTATVSFVLCGHNEEGRVGERIAELTALLKSSGVVGEVIVVSDGSTDATAAKARQHAGDHVRVLEWPRREGKAVALTAGCVAARYEILIFADCRQKWDSAAIRMLLENFADPAIGAVSGDLVLDWGPGVMAALGFYWRYEKWLRKKESQLHSTVGVTGAICAVRRSLFPGVPPGTILDDVYWPLNVTLQGHRVVHDKRAIAYDRLPEKTSDEFRRKVRTLAGNFQLAFRLPRALVPWCNPVWLQFVSHKLLRLVVPWALLVMLATSAVLPGLLYQAMFWGQVSFYALALLGNVGFVARQLRPAAAATSVVVLNAAAWLAFWVWITGRTGQSWHKVRYQKLEPAPFPVTPSDRQRAAWSDGVRAPAETNSAAR